MDPIPTNRPAELEVADAIGRLMHFWGFKRPMGRLWTILYLSAEPLAAVDLAARLTMSAGAVSMALAELEKWGCVTRSWVPGERRDFFTAEPSVWKMVQRVLRERELGLIRDFGRALDEANEALEPEMSYKRARLTHLRELASSGETLIQALVSGSAVDPTVLLKRPQP